MRITRTGKITSGLLGAAVWIAAVVPGAFADEVEVERKPESAVKPTIAPPEPPKTEPRIEPKIETVKETPREEAPAETARRRETWKTFRQHIEAHGRKDLLPEEGPDAKPPSADAIAGILFSLSPDLAAAHDLIEREPPELAGARARLKKLEGTKDPYLADYASFLKARCDLAEKDHAAARKGFEATLDSKRNFARTEARKGLAECYRGMNETTLETLELRFLIGELPPDRTADRSWAEERLAEIRRDNPGPLADSAKRMRDLSSRLASVENTEGVRTDQEKVEDILLKVAKLLEDAAKKCPSCLSSLCKACKKCGACTASGACPGGQCKGTGQGQGEGQGGDPKGNRRGGPADRSRLAQEKPGDKKLRDSTAKDADAWGSINDREVARAMQDLWGKIPPSYRQTVAQYFRDISGLETAPAAPPSAPGQPAANPGR